MPEAQAIAPVSQKLWGRKREPMKTFENVGANQVAHVQLPRYQRAIHQLFLERGGTTFTVAHITRLEIFHGEKSIWGPVTGADLNMVDRYENGPLSLDSVQATAAAPGGGNWLCIDFTLPSIKEMSGEFVGGLDLGALPSGDVRLEVEIGGATAPTLRGEVVWSPSSAASAGAYAGLMQRLVSRTYPTAAAGDFYPSIDLRGAIAARHFFRGTVMNDAVAAAHTVANAGTINTGDGAMGTLAVALRTPAGRYRMLCVEPAGNVGRFALYGPPSMASRLLGSFNVAAAFDLFGISGTLADGGTDFVSGDGFIVDVLPLNTDGNINQIEIKKNEDTLWHLRSRAARLQQMRYGRCPMAGVEVVDWILDGHIDALLDSGNAKALDYRLNLTAQDTVTVVHQTIIEAKRLLA